MKPMLGGITVLADMPMANLNYVLAISKCELSSRLVRLMTFSYERISGLLIEITAIRLRTP